MSTDTALVVIDAQNGVVGEAYHRDDVLLASDAHTTDDSETLPAEKIIAFYNETLNGFRAGERRVRVQPASEIHFAEKQTNT